MKALEKLKTNLHLGFRKKKVLCILGTFQD